MPDSMFKKKGDNERLYRTNDSMSCPVFGIDGDLCLNIQVLARSKRNSKFSAGFTNVDAYIMQLFSHIIQVKVHQVIAQVA